MLCEKCGKNNSDSVTVCKHCGEMMPQKASCGGFSDILSYNVKENIPGGSAGREYVPDETVQKLQRMEQEMNAKFRSFRKKIKSASLLAGVGLTIGILAVTFSFLYNPYAKEIDLLKEQISVLQEKDAQDRIADAKMPKGDLEKDLNVFYSVSSEYVKTSAEAWKKVKDAPPVPETEATSSDATADVQDIQPDQNEQ